MRKTVNSKQLWVRSGGGKVQGHLNDPGVAAGAREVRLDQQRRDRRGAGSRERKAEVGRTSHG